jgi:hypothetical protein
LKQSKQVGVDQDKNLESGTELQRVLVDRAAGTIGRGVDSDANAESNDRGSE